MKLQKNEVYYERVRKNEDKYAWSELNCFYRAFAIALSSIDEKYYDSFLMYITAYVSYVINGERNLSFNAGDNVLKYYNSELKDIFGTYIRKNDFTSCRSMKKDIFESLVNNEIIVIPCDLYYLPYCKTYLELHKRHYLIIKGMNRKKDIFYVLDNMHNELGASTIYTDFMMKADIVYEMCASFCDQFDDISNKKYYWSISLDENSEFGCRSKEYLKKLCSKLMNYNIEKSYEYALVNKMKEGIFDIKLFEYMEYGNIKKLMYHSAVKYLEKNYMFSKDVSDFRNQVSEYLKERERIKILFAASYKKRICCSQEMEQDICDLLENEKQLFSKLMQIVDSNECVSETDDKSEYIIVNNSKADIVRTGKTFRIALEEDKTYDLWKNSNDGVMIYRQCDSKEGCMNIDMKMDNQIGGSCQCGIILILENGKRLLFGSLGRLNIAVHELSEQPEYELFIENYPFEEEINLEVKFSEEEYCFLANGNVLYKMKSESSSSVKYYGVFAKTWEKCRCNTRFKINMK